MHSTVAGSHGGGRSGAVLVDRPQPYCVTLQVVWPHDLTVPDYTCLSGTIIMYIACCCACDSRAATQQPDQHQHRSHTNAHTELAYRWRLRSLPSQARVSPLELRTGKDRSCSCRTPSYCWQAGYGARRHRLRRTPVLKSRHVIQIVRAYGNVRSMQLAIYTVRQLCIASAVQQYDIAVSPVSSAG